MAVSFVHVVFFSSKHTPVAYPNPSRAKDKILIEAVDGGMTMEGWPISLRLHSDAQKTRGTLGYVHLLPPDGK